MNIAQEVFIDHEPSTITYEVGFRQSQVEAEQNAKPGIMAALSFDCHELKDHDYLLERFKENCGFRCEKLTRALTQCFLEGIALLDRFEFDFWTKEQ